MKREGVALQSTYKTALLGYSLSTTTTTNMSSEQTSIIVPDKYRVFLHLEPPTVHWRHGKPPTYEAVNHLFEHGRTKEWPKGSLEETVQNAIKSWEMELSHKTQLLQFNTINPEKFKLFVNGREGMSGEETLRLGSYNALLKSSLPEKFQYYKADKESFESSHEVFRACFPRGFAWEVIQVYSGPPLIAFKFRHWGFFEGPYKGHSPTGEMVQFYGLGTLKVDESLKVEEAEIYYDPAELFGGLLKGKTASESQTQENEKDSGPSVGCPFSKPK